MVSEDPHRFLPAHFPSPAPELALSRPGTQQYHAPMEYSPNLYYSKRTEQGHAHADGRSSHAHAEGHKNHPLPDWQHRDPNRAYPQPHAPSPFYNNRAYPQHHAPSSFYNNPDELLPYSNYNHLKPVCESRSLYGVYIQPSAGLYHHQHATASSNAGAKGLNKHADSASRHGPPLPEPHIPFSSGTPSTPVLYRMSAKRPPGDQSYISAPQLESCLKKDLHGNVIVTFPTFFLDDLWPVSTLPRPLNEGIFKVLTRNKVWNDIHDCFIIPPTSFTEHHMAEWLNTLGGLVGAFTNGGFERKRSWSASTHSRQPDGASINRKPDLVLVDRSFVDKSPDGTARPHISWTHIHAFAEVTTSSPFPKRIYSTINDKSYLLFVSQHDRRFVPALSFNGKGLFALTLTDRQGQISMPPISFLHGKANAFMFMKILTFLMFGPVHNAGRDTTMELRPNGHVKSISVNGHWYEVVYLIYSLQSMIGRGTTVWLVNRGGEYYILKDSWIQDSRVDSEITFLEKLKDDPKLKNHVPELIEGEDICVNGAVDSTGRYREHIGGMHDSRRHRRLVTKPIGKQITTFQSKREFILAIIDIIEVLNRLHEHHKMLHRDISPNNLLLIRPSLEGGIRSGMLIDFDYAAMIQAIQTQFRTISTGFRTGTPPFMAIDLMLYQDEPDKFFQHELRHDLESILYVILWICTSMDGPGVERRVVDPRFMDLPLHMWFDKDADIQHLGYLKLGHIVDAERAILSNFPPFWNFFKPFIRRLLTAFFPIHPIAGSDITPQKMVDILRDAAEHVDADKDSPDNVTTLEPGGSGTASYNEIFYETTVHQYLVPRKRARTEEMSGHDGHQSKKGKKPDIINFENWTSSLEDRLSRRPVTQNTSSASWMAV